MSDLEVTEAAPVPVHLIHGTGDEILDARHSAEFAAALRSHGWLVGLEQAETDHAGIIGMAYDESLGRCIPAQAPHAVRGGQLTARILVLAAGGSPSVP
ncbi:hypothetical protein [Streptomyces sp. NPDC037389]|uniref:hypothetical protein n=1 Tax=Streptomyces sp. NPDC037389 TaxID=3155369 RepID=UPI0033FDA847